MLDVDGVLVNGRPNDGRPWYTDLEKDIGIPFGKLESFFSTRWTTIVNGQKPLLPELSKFLREYAPNVKVEALIDYWFSNDSGVDQSVLASVSNLRNVGIQVFLATNQEHMRATYLMKTMGLGDYFDGILYSAALGHRKPESEYFKLASETIVGQPSEIVLVDDTEENVNAARTSGWKAILWQKGMDLRTELTRFD